MSTGSTPDNSLSSVNQVALALQALLVVAPWVMGEIESWQNKDEMTPEARAAFEQFLDALKSKSNWSEDANKVPGVDAP